MLIVFTGERGAGKSTIAKALYTKFEKRGLPYTHQSAWLQDASSPLQRFFWALRFPFYLQLRIFTAYVGNVWQARRKTNLKNRLYLMYFPFIFAYYLRVAAGHKKTLVCIDTDIFNWFVTSAVRGTSNIDYVRTLVSDVVIPQAGKVLIVDISLDSNEAISRWMQRDTVVIDQNSVAAELQQRTQRQLVRTELLQHIESLPNVDRLILDGTETAEENASKILTEVETLQRDINDKKVIGLVPYKRHLRSLYAALSKKIAILGFASLQKTRRIELGDGVEILPYKKSTFGVLPFLSLFGWQPHAPHFIRNFAGLLSGKHVDVLVVFDIYHWFLMQALRYTRRHPETKLFVWSETKRWPVSRLSRVVLSLWIRYVRRHRAQIHKVFVYTQEGQRFWAENLPEFKTELLQAPVDNQLFVPTERREWLPNGTLRILMNAQYIPYKRHINLLEAVAQLRSQDRAISVTLVARRSTGQEEVQKKVFALGLGDIVRFQGPLSKDELRQLNNQHDVLVLPSYNEAIGMVVPEAMACGLPTITSDTVGANAYISENETGFIFKTGDVQALASILNNCFNPTLLASMGQAARVRVATEFTPEAIAEKLYRAISDSAVSDEKE
ncbi:glycosyltransferase [Candidatus Nomurabacteria bacterium]|nr:glycosyltransferase [Candidatus Nomurabacteria bacterium]